MTVLFALLAKTKRLDKKERAALIGSIKKLLVDSGVITSDDIKREETAFKAFAKSLAHYINNQQLEEQEAMDLALKRYPQFNLKHMTN